MKAYEIKYNDFGLKIIFANDFAEAESKFIKQEVGLNKGEWIIKSIVYIGPAII